MLIKKWAGMSCPKWGGIRPCRNLGWRQRQRSLRLCAQAFRNFLAGWGRIEAAEAPREAWITTQRMDVSPTNPAMRNPSMRNAGQRRQGAESPLGHGLACKPIRLGSRNACVADSLPRPAPGLSASLSTTKNFALN